jgi:low temperature requirement protein LtrA
VSGQGATGDDLPLRVSSLELFFDLVFVFTITQLTSILARDMTLAGAFRVLLIFGVLWWMYGGYAWLTNARTPSRTPERLLLLLGMAGFLVIGLAIPGAFATSRGAASGADHDGLALGLGYLLVVAVHGTLYQRVNKNIWRVTPFNVASALLIIGAGLLKGGAAAYGLWVAALAVQALSPLIFRPRGRFGIQPAHFVERHGALMIVVFGESVADIGIGAAGHPVTGTLAVAAVLGLALAAALWWSYFGIDDDERAERAMTRADPAVRPVLALGAYFYAYIPMLLGVVATAAGLKRAITHAVATPPTSPALSLAGPSLALAGGVALFLAGYAAFRHELGIGPWQFRAAGAVVALATWALGVTVAIAAEITLLTVVVAATIAAESRSASRDARRPPAVFRRRGPPPALLDGAPPARPGEAPAREADREE